MSSQAKNYSSPFDAIKQTDEHGDEYWSARDLSDMLEYAQWRNFKQALEKAKIACKNSHNDPAVHFVPTKKVTEIGSGAKRRVDDYQLTRYACYLIVENADPNKEIVAQGQSYFAIQTRRQEVSDELAALSDDIKRLRLREQIDNYNYYLALAAQEAGVATEQEFGEFEDSGYTGLYGGLKRQDIHTRKQLAQEQNILDHMGVEELADNIFRAAQTEAKLLREEIKGQESANQTHHEVGRKVRQTIQDIGNTLPEELPVPPESIEELRAKVLNRMKAAGQLKPPEPEE